MNTIGTTMLCLAAEAVFAFPSYAGNIHLSQTAAALIPFGGLVPWAAFHKWGGLVAGLPATCPVTRTSREAAPGHEVLSRFVLVTATSAREHHRVELPEDPHANLLGGHAAHVDIRLPPRLGEQAGRALATSAGFVVNRDADRPRRRLGGRHARGRDTRGHHVQLPKQREDRDPVRPHSKALARGFVTKSLPRRHRFAIPGNLPSTEAMRGLN